VRKAYLIGAASDDFAATLAPDNMPDSGTVPEPASWAMLIAGFGLVGAAGRRRRLRRRGVLPPRRARHQD
jgi:hypothetical protein